MSEVSACQYLQFFFYNLFLTSNFFNEIFKLQLKSVIEKKILKLYSNFLKPQAIKTFLVEHKKKIGFKDSNL